MSVKVIPELSGEMFKGYSRPIKPAINSVILMNRAFFSISFFTNHSQVNVSLFHFPLKPYLSSTSILFSQVFPGNIDRIGIVKNLLKNQVKARFVRFYPISHHNGCVMSVEIFVL